MWAAKGTRPRAIRQQQLEYAYIFGATCPAKDKALRLVLPVANTEGHDRAFKADRQKTDKLWLLWIGLDGIRPRPSTVLIM